jgi:hypothetical protein
VPLGRVAGQIVELRLRRFDVFQAVAAKRAQRTPVVKIEWQEGLGVQGSRTSNGAQQIAAVAAVRPRADQRKNGRCHVDQPDRLVGRSRTARHSGPADDERDPER